MSEEANAGGRKAPGIHNWPDRSPAQPERVLTSDRWLTEENLRGQRDNVVRKGYRKHAAYALRLEQYRLGPGQYVCTETPSGHLPGYEGW